MQEEERARKRIGKGKKAERNWNGDPSRLQEEENRGNKDVSERPVPSAINVVLHNSAFLRVMLPAWLWQI